MNVHCSGGKHENGGKERVVAVTGAHGFLGSRLIEAMERDDTFGKILALDVRKPAVKSEKTVFQRIDLTLPTAGSAVAQAMRGENVDTVVHLAFLSDFTPRAEWAHELESVGTMHMLNACMEAEVSRYIHWGFTACYGARPDNPNFLTEDRPLPRFGEWNFLADKVEAEQQVAEFRRRNPHVCTAVLRTAPMVGPGIGNFITRYLGRGIVPVLMGYDPMIQLLHEDDAVDAFMHALKMNADGVYNIVGRSILPLRRILTLMGKKTVSLPLSGAVQGARMLWMAQLSNVPSGFWDFLKYPCVADGSKAEKELGWRAKYNVREIAESFRSGKRAVDVQREKGEEQSFFGDNKAEEFDEFGFDPAVYRKLEPLLELLYTKYLRVSVSGIANIPSSGKALLVANRSGALPLDVVMLLYAVYKEHPAERRLRVLLEDMVFYFPFLGGLLNKIGGVRACRENGERVLNGGGIAAVFPEGVHGMRKPFKKRYQLQRFGRGGFIKLALKTRSPVIPTAIIGAEESYPMLSKVDWFSRSLDIPYIPVTPIFPFLGPLGLAPVPSKWSILIGEPVRIHEDYGSDDAGDSMLVNKLAEKVRAVIQEMINKALQDRESVFWG